MQLKPSQLRVDLYRLLDHIIQTGQPIEIIRDDNVLAISLAKPADKFEKLKKRNITVGDSNKLVEVDWSKNWKPSQ